MVTFVTGDIRSYKLFQFKDMMCSKLQLPTLADSTSGNPGGGAMSPLSTYYGNHELGAESHAQRALYHWCQSQVCDHQFFGSRVQFYLTALDHAFLSF